jgi:hypothetical protein
MKPHTTITFTTGYLDGTNNLVVVSVFTEYKNCYMNDTNTNLGDNQPRKQGRPKGSGRTNGYKLSKMTKPEVEHFMVESAKQIFNRHLSYQEYIDWCRNQSISASQASKYWKRVWDTVKEKFRLEKDMLVDKHLKAYWDIHTTAMNQGDLTNARQTLDAIGKMMGLNEPDKVDVKTEIKLKFNFGDSEDGNQD